MVSRATVFNFLVDPEDAGERLDVYLAGQSDPPVSRSQVRKHLDSGEITVNGQALKAGYSLRADDLICWNYTPPVELSLSAQPIPLDILFDDPHLAVLNKPARMVVHPAPGHPDGTLANALLYHFENLAETGGALRPGIVHRLDKDTSGALVITKTEAAQQVLSAQFRRREPRRLYHALVFGPGLADSGVFDTFHARHPNHRTRFSGKFEAPRRAITHFKVLERFDSGVCLVECRLKTGRTHQIRMHLYEANAPILGDELYGGKATRATKLIARQALHARRIAFSHPGGEYLEFEAPYPDDFAAALHALRAGKDWR